MRVTVCECPLQEESLEKLSSSLDVLHRVAVSINVEVEEQNK